MSFIRVNTTVRKYKVVVQGIKWRTTANGGTLYSVEEMEAALPGMFYEFMLPQNHPDMESRTGSLLVLQNGTDGTDQIATVGNLIYLKETDGHFRVIQARNKYTVIEITDWNDIEFTGEGTYILKDVSAATHRPTILEAPGDGVTKQYNCTLIGNDDSWTLLMFTGSKKYVWDFKSNTITEMASGTGGGGTGGTVTYTNPNKVPTKLGGIAANTTFNEKTMQEMWDALLYPETNPTVEPPTYNLKSDQPNFKEVGSQPDITFTNEWYAGKIKPLYRLNETTNEWEETPGYPNGYPRVGNPTYSGVENGIKTIVLGANTWQRVATFAQGVMPKTSKGNDFPPKYPASEATGTLTSSTTVYGVYPIYATTALENNVIKLVKQGLQSHGSEIIKTLAPELGGSQTLKIPYSVTIDSEVHYLWLITKAYVDFQGNWIPLVINNTAEKTIDTDFEVTTETIGGVTYKVYTQIKSASGWAKYKFTV